MEIPNFMNNNVISHNNFDNYFANNSLDVNETAGLLYMREEEKLAHDVYVTLDQQWGLPVFHNIANGEINHQNQVAVLLDNYQIPENIEANPVGFFVNPDLQQLYNNLVLQGSQSLTEALKVGILIEKTDIADLQVRLNQTDNLDIQQVYRNLLRASENHLNSFSSNLTSVVNNTGIYPLPNLGEQVQPDFIDDLLTGGMRCNGRGNQSNQGFAGNRRQANFSQNYPGNSGDYTDCILTAVDPVNNVKNSQGFLNTGLTNQGVTVINPVDSYYSPNDLMPSQINMMSSTVTLIPNNTW